MEFHEAISALCHYCVSLVSLDTIEPSSAYYCTLKNQSRTAEVKKNTFDPYSPVPVTLCTQQSNNKITPQKLQGNVHTPKYPTIIGHMKKRLHEKTT